ncbi:MAG: hypothetical protein JOZ15_08685, partial [Acidobacteria bacterium]|nr:hypothetical protein [Acidobacteriota bacterium]
GAGAPGGTRPGEAAAAAADGSDGDAAAQLVQGKERLRRRLARAAGKPSAGEAT